MLTFSPRITIIAAISENRGLGIKNQLLWKIPKDLSFFKKITSGNPVIMGNNTYASIGRALPNRFNIIVSNTLVQQGVNIDGCEVVASIEEAIALANHHLTLRGLSRPEPTESTSDDAQEESILLAKRHLTPHVKSADSVVEPEIFILGGAQVYNHALKNDMVDRVLLTEIHQTTDADVFFPVLEKNLWQEVWRESHFDEKNGLAFDFVDYRKCI